MVQLLSSPWVALLAGMGFDLITIAPLILSHFGFFFVFGCREAFLIGFSVFLSLVVQHLVVILFFL